MTGKDKLSTIFCESCKQPL